MMAARIQLWSILAPLVLMATILHAFPRNESLVFPGIYTAQLNYLQYSEASKRLGQHDVLQIDCGEQQQTMCRAHILLKSKDDYESIPSISLEYNGVFEFCSWKRGFVL